MRVLGLLLAVAIFLAPIGAHAQPSKGSDDAMQTMFDRLEKMTPAEQQAWLQRLEARALRAAQLTLSPDEAVVQQKKVRSQLHRKLVTWQTLREVIEDTSTRERIAIDRLAQRYRTLLDELLRKQPDLLARRQQEWLDVDNRWKLAGNPFDEQDRLIDWLEAGIAEAAKPQPAEESVEPPAVAESKSVEEPKPVEKAEVTQSQMPEQLAEPPAVAEAKAAEEPKAAEEALEPQVATESESLEEPKEALEPAKAQIVEQPDDVRLETAPPQVAEIPLPSDELADALPEDDRLAARRPLQPGDGDQQATTEASSSLPAAVTRQTEPLEEPATDAKQLPLPRQASVPVNSLLPSVDAETPQTTADVGLPMETRVQPPSVNELPPQTEPSYAEELPPDSVEVKIDELAVRIGGCNMAFRALEMELDEKGAWTAARIEPLVEQLEMLALRRSDLSLFREAVPEEKRDLLDPLPSLKGVVSQVATRIVEARGLASGSSFKGTDSERQAELQRLDGLSRRLADLAEP